MVAEYLRSRAGKNRDGAGHGVQKVRINLGIVQFDAANPNYMFIADRKYQVLQIDYIHKFQEVTAGSMDITVERFTGTSGTGTAIHPTAFDGLLGDNVLQSRVSGFTAAQVVLNDGDRVGIEAEAAVTELDDAVITLHLLPLPSATSTVWQDDV